MANYHPFIVRFGKQNGLTDVEQDYLHAASVRSERQLRRLLENSPDLGDTPEARQGAFRPNHLRQSVGIPDSARTAGIAAPLVAPRSLFGGALGPSLADAGGPTKIPIRGGLERPLGPGDSLHGEQAFRLQPKFLVFQWRARDQLGQNTCVAFAAAGCVEYALSLPSGKFVDLSERFLYQRMRALPLTDVPAEKIPPGYKEGATKLGMAQTVLQQDGICLESEWEYERDIPVVGEAAATASAASRRQLGLTFHPDWIDAAKRPSGIARMLLDQLKRSNRPIAIAFPIFSAGPDLPSNWDLGDVADTGIVANPPSTWTALEMGHAVTVVGFQPDPHEHVGGWFEFKNSAGDNFAAKPDLKLVGEVKPETPAKGYGLISATYVDSYCWEMLGYGPV